MSMKYSWMGESVVMEKATFRNCNIQSWAIYVTHITFSGVMLTWMWCLMIQIIMELLVYWIYIYGNELSWLPAKDVALTFLSMIHWSLLLTSETIDLYIQHDSFQSCTTPPYIFRRVTKFLLVSLLKIAMLCFMSRWCWIQMYYNRVHALWDKVVPLLLVRHLVSSPQEIQNLG